MSNWHVMFARVRELFRRARIERDLGEELRNHLNLLADEYVRRGLSPEAARAAANRDFGGVDRAAEAVRDRRGFPSIERLVRDVGYAARLLRRAPGFTIAAVLTLALGIGANTAIFSLVDAALFRPLPYHEPERLMSVWELVAREATGGPPQRTVLAPANVVDYQRAQSLSDLAAFTLIARTLTGSGDPDRLFGEEVTPTYFDVLAATPALGRRLVPADTEGTGRRVVVLSHGLWRDRFGGSPEIVGQSIVLDDVATEVIGVMPASFMAVSQIDRPDPIAFWTPMVFSPDLLASRHDHMVSGIARLAPGATEARARDELQAIAAGFGLPATGPGLSVDLGRLQTDVARDVQTLLVLLLGAVGLILLLACVNVASLLIVRSAGRRREIAVRFALGATRGRIVRELITQSVVLAALGATAGWLLAAWLKDLLVGVTPTTMPRLEAVSLDVRVLVFTAGLAAITGLAFGLLPAWQLSRTAPVDALGSTSRAVAGHWGERSRRLLLVAEAALSMLLLVGAGLMIRSLTTLNQVNLGFDPANILTAGISLPPHRYPTPAARLQFFEQLASRVQAVPGVRTVAFANRLPLRGAWSSGFGFDPQSHPAGVAQAASAGFQSVSPGYFPMFGLSAIRGRVLEDGDREGRPPVAVVNEQFGRALLGGADPIGRRIRRHAKAPWVEIVGVVPDIRRDGRAANVEPQLYLPAAQTSLYPLPLSDLAVQHAGSAEALTALLRGAVWSIDRDQPVARVLTLERTLAVRQADRQFQTLLFALFAALSLILAVIGIYGVVSYSVSQRTSEIGVRIALGADPARIIRSIVVHSLKLVVAGGVAGVAVALWLTQWMRALLFQTSPADVVSYAAAAGVLTAAASAACYVAARRATRVEPSMVLR